MDVIKISENLQLRRYDGHYELFLPAYQDPYVYQNSEGIFDESKKPDLDYVKGMCDWLSTHGDMYYIEVKEGGHFVPIGDVTVKPENPPITIWKEEYRNKGIGKAVMRVVMQVLKGHGVEKITGSAVYKWNLPSRRMHEAAGFHVVGETENEWILEADLSAIN